jgi:chromosome segregation ATPase
LQGLTDGIPNLQQSLESVRWLLQETQLSYADLQSFNERLSLEVQVGRQNQDNALKEVDSLQGKLRATESFSVIISNLKNQLSEALPAVQKLDILNDEKAQWEETQRFLEAKMTAISQSSDEKIRILNDEKAQWEETQRFLEAKMTAISQSSDEKIRILNDEKAQWEETQRFLEAKMTAISQSSDEKIRKMTEEAESWRSEKVAIVIREEKVKAAEILEIELKNANLGLESALEKIAKLEGDMSAARKESTDFKATNRNMVKELVDMKNNFRIVTEERDQLKKASVSTPVAASRAAAVSGTINSSAPVIALPARKKKAVGVAKLPAISENMNSPATLAYTSTSPPYLPQSPKPLPAGTSPDTKRKNFADSTDPSGLSTAQPTKTTKKRRESVRLDHFKGDENMPGG